MIKIQIDFADVLKAEKSNYMTKGVEKHKQNAKKIIEYTYPNEF